MAAEKMLGRVPSSTPLVSWFEFLLDKTGKLLKEHVAAENADPSPMQLCRQFLHKCPQHSQSAGFQLYQPQENERTKQLRFLALAVASYINWDLEEISKNLQFNFQYLLMTELIRNYGLTENAMIDKFQPEDMDKRTLMVWILFHRWIVSSIVKINSNKKTEKNKQRPGNSNIYQEEQMIPMLYGYLPHSLCVLNECLRLSHDLEVPFPRSIETYKKELPSTSQNHFANIETTRQMELNTEHDSDDVSTIDVAAPKIESNHTPAENVYDEVIPLKLEHIKMQIYAELGSFHFFQEDYHDAFKNFIQLFESLKKEKDFKLMKNLSEIKGCFLACSMICNIPINDDIFKNENDTLMYRTEKCLANRFEGIFELLKEDNLKEELPLNYRGNIEELIISDQRKDLLFKVCACNAVRGALAGNLLPSSFLKSLKNAKEEEIVIIIELCNDIYANSSKRMHIDYLKRFLRSISRFLSKDMSQSLHADKRLSPLLPAKDTIFEEGNSDIFSKDSAVPEDSSITCITIADSTLLESVSGFNSKDDPYFIKREIMLSTNADYLKQLVAQLSVVCPGKDLSTGFQCLPYTDLITEIRDPITQVLLHIFLLKARELAGKQELGQSLGILSNALEVLNQYCIQSGNNPHTNRIKNIIHHEMLSAKVQWEQNKQDTSLNVDTLRLCKACYHHREQDPLPKKETYCHIVSYLLNNKEWQFLIDERGNFEGITDFMERTWSQRETACFVISADGTELVILAESIPLGYQLATVSVGLCKAGDAVCKHANELWNTVIKVVCDCVGSTGQPLMAFERSPQGTRRSPATVTKNDFTMFLNTLKNNTVLSVLASCLISIVNLLKNNEQIELKALYSHIWPTKLDFDNIEGKREQISSVLNPLLDKIIALDPRNIAWLRNKADILLVEGKYRDAMKQYLEVGAMTSNMFSVPVPFHAWDDQVYQRMIDCCLKQKLYSQVVVLCQFVEPVDYGTVLKAIQENGKFGDLIDTTYDCIWDPTILEFLIYAHSKRGEIDKKQIAVKMIGQPELNSCNSPDTLKQTSNLRKCKFLRFLAKFYWNGTL